MIALTVEYDEMNGRRPLDELDRRAVETVQVLIKHGADIHARDRQGMTALMFAVHTGKTSAAKLLIDHGAKIDDYNMYGENVTAFYNYELDGDGRMADILALAHTPVTVPVRWEDQYTRDIRLLEAVYDCDTAAATEALDLGADVNTRYDHEGTVPVIHALVNDCTLDMLELLVRVGAWADASNYNGTTILMRAVMAGNHEFAEYLLSKDADPDRKNDYGNTALIFAAKNGDYKMIDLLSSAGADLNAADNSGLTAVQTARQYGHDHIAEYLIYLGAEDDGGGVDLD